MIKFGKIIDKLIEVSTSNKLDDGVKHQLDIIIEELVEFEVKQMECAVLDDEMSAINWNRNLSPEELEEIQQFEMLVRDVMNDKLALA